MQRTCSDEEDRLEALKRALAERALSSLGVGEDGDHRLAVYRSPAGQLMCVARAGTLVSETRIVADICGTDHGCEGTWRCLSADADHIEA